MTRFLYAFIQLSGLLLSLSTISAQEGLGLEARSTNVPIVDLGYVQYAGVINSTTGNTVFLGVRYAAPPTGTAPSSSLFLLLTSVTLQEVCAGAPRSHRRQRRASNLLIPSLQSATTYSPASGWRQPILIEINHLK